MNIIGLHFKRLDAHVARRLRNCAQPVARVQFHGAEFTVVRARGQQ